LELAGRHGDGDPKVAQVGVAVLVEQDVGGPHVPVDHALPVRGRQRRLTWSMMRPAASGSRSLTGKFRLVRAVRLS
jgi:hypothetical protein